MHQLANKCVLIGVSGGIAAYKSAELIRRLKEHGADVRVVMTKSAQEFITPLTLQALSGNPVHTQLLDPAAEAAMGHIELARWADLVLIAPASANIIAKLANGICDDLLTTLCLATTSPIAIAPAMNQAMWKNQATQSNVSTLAGRGVIVLGPAQGLQACGDFGPGRMLDPIELAQFVAGQFHSHQLQGVKLVITAGPTREAIDPVRYISNHSSGKMGFALAQAAADAGALVTLIAGPVALDTPKRVNRIDVQSAEQMYNAAISAAANCNIFIATAAVADYRPKLIENQKIKKVSESLTIDLVRNNDIVAAVATGYPQVFTVGFAAETQHLADYAKSKLKKKNLAMVVANDVSTTKIGFNSENNEVTVFWAGGEASLPFCSKTQLSRQLLALISAHYIK